MFKLCESYKIKIISSISKNLLGWMIFNLLSKLCLFFFLHTKQIQEMSEFFLFIYIFLFICGFCCRSRKILTLWTFNIVAFNIIYFEACFKSWMPESKKLYDLYKNVFYNIYFLSNTQLRRNIVAYLSYLKKLYLLLVIIILFLSTHVMFL